MVNSQLLKVFLIVSSGGLEPPTYSLEGCRSIQLSYEEPL